jgi:signal transduction histidine kinase/ligand-binding sensor domain-containing protein
VLWVASELGLFQFDGVRFERFAPPPGQTLPGRGAHVLLALPDSSLWVGHFTTGVSVLRHGSVITYDTTAGLMAGTVTAIARDSAGTMWASTTRGLARLNGRRWEEIGPGLGYPGGFTEPVLVDARGSVWAVSERGIYVLPRGATRFQSRSFPRAAGRDPTFHWLAIAPDGSIWGVQRPVGLLPIADARGDPPADLAVAYADTVPFALAFARDRPAVITSTSGRLVRLWLPQAAGSPRDSGRAPARPTSVEIPFSRALGMSGDRVMAALYDREGTLWVGTPTGIDRFRKTKLTPIVWPGHVNWPGVAPDTNGAVWVAARNAAPAALFTIGSRVEARPDAPSTLTAIHRDLRGDIWVGGEYRLWKRNGDRLVSVPLPARRSSASPGTLPVHAIARDRSDRLWVSIGGDGVYCQCVGTGWERFGSRLGLEGAVATTITAESNGRIWLGYPSGQIALVVGDSVGLLPADRVNVGSILAISAHGNRVWVAGQMGVAVLAAPDARRTDGMAFTSLVTDDEPLRGVSGVVETAGGEVWLNGADGVTRIPAAEVRRALTEPGYRVRYERLDHRDGIEPPAPQVRPLPTAVAGTDGRIWFTSAGGVSWVDPVRIRRNTVPPPVRLRALMADRVRYQAAELAAGDSIRLPPRTTAVSFSYTAYSLAVPERVRFKYRLEGVDAEWQDALARREAFYTNLRPGRYRFRVIAANDDGVWNEVGAALSFRVLAAWHQTAWFQAFGVMVIAGLGATVAVLVQRRRHRQLQKALQADYQATLAERARIAQDLHDTLLQGFAGVTLQLKTAELALPEQPDVAAETIFRVQQLARESLREARERVWDMRETVLGDDDLAGALEAFARERTARTGIEVNLTTAGEAGRLPGRLTDTAFRIGREAIVNAVQHAEPRRIDIHLVIGPRTFRLEVHDDGRGFNPAAAEAARRHGHFGLSGAQERARQMGGRCQILSHPGGGTKVVVDLPLTADQHRPGQN